MSHPTTDEGRLARLGFQDPESAKTDLGELGEEVAEPLVALIARTADPDLALNRLVDLVDTQDDPEPMLRALVDDEGTAMRLLSVLGASEALADHLCRHPEHWRELTDPSMGSTRRRYQPGPPSRNGATLPFARRRSSERRKGMPRSGRGRSEMR